jgi:UDP-2,3-diacylglucosamine pyrophosphatase LpxH
MQRDTKDGVVFHGDTLRNLARQYSNYRMGRDPKYRRAVLNAVAQRKAERKAHTAQQPDVKNE